MKTLYKTIKIALGVFVIAALAVSCLPEQETIGDAGQTLVKYSPTDDFSLIAVNSVSTAQSFTLLTIRRDLPNTEELNKSTTVDLTLDLDGSMINKYNEANETNFVPMPANLYTSSPALANGKVTFTFNPGDFAKSLEITVPNANNFDFSKTYMIAYKVSVSGAGALSNSVNDTVYRQIMAKNRFDGVYSVTGTMVDLANATITGNYPMTVNLVTTGKNQVRFEEPAALPWGSAIFHSILSAGNMSVYGAFGLVIDFDDADNVVSVINYYGQPAANTRSAEIDPSGINKYDADSKTVNIKYFMKQPSVVTAPPNIRTTFDETWTYSGPR